MLSLWKRAPMALSSAATRAFAAASNEADVLIVGAGHNGLVAATLLARQGLQVRVVEEKDMVGGAVRTEYPFSKAPGLGQSTGGPKPAAQHPGAPDVQLWRSRDGGPCCCCCCLQATPPPLRELGWRAWGQGSCAPPPPCPPPPPTHTSPLAGPALPR
jgi:hypothetical protein